MAGSQHRLSTVGRAVVIAYVLLLWGSSLVGCGGGGGPANEKGSTDKASVGRTIKAGTWEVTLTAVAEKIKVVGKGDITYQAKGVYIVVPLKVSNVGSEMQLLGAEEIAVSDAQGREFRPTVSAVQVAYGLPRGMEIILDSPLAAGASRESIIIYDVPPDATGLQLVLKGSEDRLDLGF